MDFSSLTYPTEPSQNVNKSPLNSVKDPKKKEKDLACQTLAKMFNNHAMQKKKVPEQKPKVSAATNKFVKPNKIKQHRQDTVETPAVKIRENDLSGVDVLARSQTRSQGSRREKQSLIEPMVALQTRTEDANS